MECRFDNFICESCLEVQGENCSISTTIGNLPPNLTIYLHFINPYNFRLTREYIVNSDGEVEVLNSQLPAGWWGMDFFKIEVQASTDEAGCNIISFTYQGNEYGCLLYTFVNMPTETDYTSSVCGIRKASGNTTGDVNSIQNSSLIGANELMVFIDGGEVNDTDNNGNTNWTFNSATGTITFTYTLPNAPYSILAF